MKSGKRLSVLLVGVVVVALVGVNTPVAQAGGGAAKCMQIYVHYQMPAAHLVPGDEVKLARYDMFSFNRHRYYDLTPDTYSLVRAINPDIIILNYVHGPGIWTGWSEGDWSMDSEDVLGINNISRYSNARGHSMGNLNDDNPGLFLLNSSGERIHTYYKSFRWLMDFGSAEYQAYWVEAVQTDMIDRPWRPDGIYVDNCMPTWASYFCERPAKYPTDAAYTAAMHSFQTGMAAGLHALGLKLVPNSGHTTDAAGFAANLAIDADPDHPDFICEEGAFVHGWAGDGLFYPEVKWKRQIDLMVLMQNSGPLMRSHVNIPEGGSGVDNYGRAFTYWDALWYAMGSYLLGKNDTLNNAHWTFSNKIDKYYKLYWYDEYDRIDLGVAVGNYQVTNYGGKNIYWREFEKGYVYINPTTGDVSGITLPAPCKQLSHATINDDPAMFADVTSINLDVHRAAVLIKSSSLGAQIAGRHIFYNNCYFDGDDPTANAADDAAIATDKKVLLDGQVATFANYTSYARGINGIMVDIANLAGIPTASDFAFKVGNDNIPSGWATGPAPASIAVRPGAGASGSDRVTLIWADNAIEKQWFEVTVLATANTGLSSDDVFYFGNAPGETGNSPSDAKVTPTDEIAVRNNPHTLGINPATIDDTCDFNRDRKVGPTDAVICRNNGTSGPTALQLIVLIANQPPTADAGPDDSITLPTNMVSLDGTVSDDGYPLPPALTTTWTKLSGPGTVTFGDSSAVDTTATFLAAGPYVLQLEAHDGELSDSDTVQINVIDPTGIFFADDFDDNNLNGWTTLEGSFETFQFLTGPGYEVHATVRDSRMRANLTNPSLTDTVYISFKIRHTYGAPPGGGGSGWKWGQVFLVDDSGNGFGLGFALDRTGSGELELRATGDDGASDSMLGAYSTPDDPGGYDLEQVQLVYNRITDQVECFYDGGSKGTFGISSSYRNFTRVLVRLYNHYDADWGQIDIDEIRISNSP